MGKAAPHNWVALFSDPPLPMNSSHPGHLISTFTSCVHCPTISCTTTTTTTTLRTVAHPHWPSIRLQGNLGCQGLQGAGDQLNGII
jgi:hypothetical protein